MSNYQVIIRALPIDAEVTPDLLWPQHIDPCSPLYKETHLVGNPKVGFCIVETIFCQERVHPDDSNMDTILAAKCEAISGLIRMKKHDLPSPVISGPTKRKRSSFHKPTIDSSANEASMEPASPQSFIISSSIAESPKDLISPNGSIIKVEPRILPDGTLGGYNVKIPDKLSLKSIAGYTGKSSFNSEIGKKQQAQENPDQNPSGGASCSTSKFWGFNGMNFDAPAYFDAHQYIYNEGLHFCDICFQKCEGIPDLLRHRKNHDM